MKKILIFILLLSFSVPSLAKNQDKQKKQKAMPPGLQKKYEKTGELPPGWQKKLVKGEVLDLSLYNVAKKYQIKPGDYSIEPRKGTELLRIEDRIIRIMKDTKEILEVFGIKTN